ncbi:hypothetical protein N7491_001415 [Penicillium cf. griseofulvum]|uniref:Uncharacterized protein n=1 Tax=Penicillium cf. griseofulvum TaxID=2972120 RepID=A0A9W9M9W6_9EURO|nr:hypothetical protein N7472_006545 [Penicillium cf. griseofulvum]KAJ5445333.1 hypothetical protein N7491_001415 [Penicillium cf. griseofulvum]KAJ5447052.1 hypothetical protein N7445_001873 [Penicillium cf. griseofulvum]
MGARAIQRAPISASFIPHSRHIGRSLRLSPLIASATRADYRPLHTGVILSIPIGIYRSISIRNSHQKWSIATFNNIVAFDPACEEFLHCASS